MPGSAKIGLDDQRAADQPADIDAGHRHQGERGRLQRMDQQDARRPQALGLGHGDVVLLQGGDHVGAQHAHQHRPFGEGQRQRRQHEAAQVADGILGERHPAGGRQPVELDGEQVDQQDRHHEGRQRQLAEGEPGQEAVDRAAALHRAQDGERNADRRGPSPRRCTISSSDTGRRSVTAASTVSPVRKERPRSPCSTPHSQCR